VEPEARQRIARGQAGSRILVLVLLLLVLHCFYKSWLVKCKQKQQEKRNKEKGERKQEIITT
jgi:cell division protein FtsB